jgi:hypothetical protein
VTSKPEFVAAKLPLLLHPKPALMLRGLKDTQDPS